MVIKEFVRYIYVSKSGLQLNEGSQRMWSTWCKWFRVTCGCAVLLEG
jgi:hypothetical protein